MYKIIFNGYEAIMIFHKFLWCFGVQELASSVYSLVFVVGKIMMVSFDKS